jgi:hypothetical protein
MRMNCRRWQWNGTTSERNRWSTIWDRKVITFLVGIQSMSETTFSSPKMIHVIDKTQNQKPTDFIFLI